MQKDNPATSENEGFIQELKHPQLVSAAETKAKKVLGRENQDYFIESPGSGFFIVCDGVGSLKGGEIASKIAADTIHESFGTEDWRSLEDDEIKTKLKLAFLKAHRRILSAPERSENGNMSTTAAAVLIKGKNLFVCHVGDSRVYLMKNGDEQPLQLLTVDHSSAGAEPEKVRNLLDNLTDLKDKDVEKLDPEEQDKIEYLFDTRNEVTAVLGSGVRNYRQYLDGLLHVSQYSLDAGDLILLTTDGVHDPLTTKEVESILKEKDITPAQAAGLIVYAAEDVKNMRAKPDDRTAIVVRFTGEEESKFDPSEKLEEKRKKDKDFDDLLNSETLQNPAEKALEPINVVQEKKTLPVLTQEEAMSGLLNVEVFLQKEKDSQEQIISRYKDFLKAQGFYGEDEEFLDRDAVTRLNDFIQLIAVHKVALSAVNSSDTASNPPRPDQYYQHFTLWYEKMLQMMGIDPSYFYGELSSINRFFTSNSIRNDEGKTYRQVIAEKVKSDILNLQQMSSDQ